MKNLFLEDELKYFFLRFYWDVCLFTLVKPIIMGGVWFSLRHDFNTYRDVLMQVPARSLRQNLIHPPFVKRVYSECSPLIQLIALINNLKADKNDTILVMIESKSHSFCRFAFSVSRLYLNSYNPECKILDCFVCKSRVTHLP